MIGLENLLEKMRERIHSSELRELFQDSTSAVMRAYEKGFTDAVDIFLHEEK